MPSNGRVFVRRRLVFLAWYPLRGRRCMARLERAARNGWHLSLALGPAYLGLGPGVPTP